MNIIYIGEKAAALYPLKNFSPLIQSIKIAIFESSSKVINRLFYLVPDFFNSNLRIFIFYEENTFLKDSKQNLKLIQSNLKIQYNKTEYLAV